MAASKTNEITVPKCTSSVKKKYVTNSGGKLNPEDISLIFALDLRIHGTVDSLRRSARMIADDVCFEHQPNMKRLSREKSDAKVLDAVLKIINRVCDLFDILPGQDFELNEELLHD